MGGIATDHVTANYVETALAAGFAAGTTVITVDDASAIVDHPNGTLDWAPVTN